MSRVAVVALLVVGCSGAGNLPLAGDAANFCVEVLERWNDRKNACGSNLRDVATAQCDDVVWFPSTREAKELCLQDVDAIACDAIAPSNGGKPTLPESCKKLFPPW